MYGGENVFSNKKNTKIKKRTSTRQEELPSFYRLEKTLIHEAFHIIGGCVEGQSKDLICEDSVEKDCAFDKIVSKNSIQEMEADDFAQFIMMC